MKKLFNVLLCLSSLLMINSFVINKKTDFNETPTLINAKGIDIKKVQFGDNEEVKTSDKIYTQWARLDDNSNSTSLRFAIAVKGNIETIKFTRSEVIGLETTKEANVVNVDTVYKSITANNKNYYYTTSEGLSEKDNDSYYWACYTINYSENSSLKQNNIELSVKINDLDPITTKASLVGTQYLDNNAGHEHTFVKKHNTNKVFNECSECGTIDNIEDYIPVESITLTNFYQEKIVLGSKDSGTKKLNVSISPSNATFANDIKYEIKDEKVATLSQKDGTTSIAKKGIGKTELEISCDGVKKSIPVEVIELNDNNLIKDSSELEIKKVKEITTPGWYTFFDDDYFKNTLTMSEGVITGTSTKQATASQKPQLFQIRYLPADNEGNPYIGEYYLGFKVTNNTDTKLNIKYNINGDNLSDTYSLDKGKGVLRVRLHLSLAKVEDVYDFFSLKISKVGKGTFTINEIYFIPVTNN